MKKWIKRLYLGFRYDLYVLLHGGYDKVIRDRKFLQIKKKYREFLADNF